MGQGPKPAGAAIIRANHEAASHYDFDDTQDLTDATCGLNAPLPEPQTKRHDGVVMIEEDWLAFLRGDKPAPDSVDANLWRQSQLITQPGLYQVVDRLSQVRNTDMANVTIVDGAEGLVIIDCASDPEVCKAGLDLFHAAVADRFVVAVTLTHTHRHPV